MGEEHVCAGAWLPDGAWEPEGSEGEWVFVGAGSRSARGVAGVGAVPSIPLEQIAAVERQRREMTLAALRAGSEAVGGMGHTGSSVVCGSYGMPGLGAECGAEAAAGVFAGQEAAGVAAPVGSAAVWEPYGMAGLSVESVAEAGSSGFAVQGAVGVAAPISSLVERGSYGMPGLGVAHGGSVGVSAGKGRSRCSVGAAAGRGQSRGFVGAAAGRGQSRGSVGVAAGKGSSFKSCTEKEAQGCFCDYCHKVYWGKHTPDSREQACTNCGRTPLDFMHGKCGKCYEAEQERRRLHRSAASASTRSS